MTLPRDIRKSIALLQAGWARLSSAAFAADAAGGGREDAARGEFISPFICETPDTASRRMPRPRRRNEAGGA